MRKSRVSEEQIIGGLKEDRAGLPVAEEIAAGTACEATFYTSRSKYGAGSQSWKPNA